ncbi:MAG: hypothetical protein NTW58_03750 [Actinobacteria bacterium]|nr:hypothetical protein [Actinomycetota bacterium]
MEARVFGENVPRKAPELVVETVEHRVALDAQLLVGVAPMLNK